MNALQRSVAVFTAITIAATPFAAFAKGGFGGGGGFKGGGFSSPSRSFSTPSPSRSFSTPSPSRSFSAPSAPSKPFFSSPKPAVPAPAPSRSATPPPTPRQQPSVPQSTKQTPAYDNAAANAMQRQQSRDAFQAAQGKRGDVAVPRDPGVTLGGSGRTPRETAIPRDYSSRQWATRDARAYERFGPTYAPSAAPAVTSYSDGFNPWFWMWLMSQNQSHERDRFIYNHRDQMDPARLEELKKNDAKLEERLAALEKAGEKRDPKYVPKDFTGDADLIYKDEVAAAKAKEAAGFSTYLWAALIVILLGAGLWYLVFVHQFTVKTRRGAR